MTTTLFLCMLMATQLFCIAIGIDRLTALPWSSPVAWWVSAAVAAIIAWLTDRDLLMRVRRRGMKHSNNPFVFGVIRVATASFTALLGGAVAGSLVGTVAQHVPGQEQPLLGTVVKVEPGYSSRNPCRRSATFVPDGAGGSAFDICYKTTSYVGPAASPELHTGDRIRVTLRKTFAGTVITQVIGTDE